MQTVVCHPNRLEHRLSEQSVRLMINHDCEKADIEIHIAPHMFRHFFAAWQFANPSLTKHL